MRRSSTLGLFIRRVTFAKNAFVVPIIRHSTIPFDKQAYQRTINNNNISKDILNYLIPGKTISSLV